MTRTIIATVLIFSSGIYAGYGMAVIGLKRMLASGEITRNPDRRRVRAR
jgi:hypothetical protein